LLLRSPPSASQRNLLIGLEALRVFFPGVAGKSFSRNFKKDRILPTPVGWLDPGLRSGLTCENYM
jgi:hypothetical protein